VKLLLLAGIGSFIGGMLRLLVSDLIQTKSLSAFPYGTLAVNITGCFLIGIVFAFFQKETISSEWKIFLATGLIGGLPLFQHSLMKRCNYSDKDMSLMPSSIYSFQLFWDLPLR